LGQSSVSTEETYAAVLNESLVIINAKEKKGVDNRDPWDRTRQVTCLHPKPSASGKPPAASSHAGTFAAHVLWLHAHLLLLG